MAELRDLCGEIGLHNPRTLLASGNLLFDSPSSDPAGLSQQLEEAVAGRFGLKKRIFVLSPEEFRAILQADPIDPAGKDGAKWAVMFLDEAPSAADVKAFQERHTGPEEVHFQERAVYLYYPNGQGRSKLDLGRCVGSETTVRNQNTLQKILALLEG